MMSLKSSRVLQIRACGHSLRKIPRHFVHMYRCHRLYSFGPCKGSARIDGETGRSHDVHLRISPSGEKELHATEIRSEISPSYPSWQGQQSVPSQGHDPSASRIPGIWLRDHCQCAECVHPDTKQRQFDTFGTDHSFKIKEFDEIGSGCVPSNGFRVVWEDGHESFYGNEWLQEILNPVADARRRIGEVRPILWSSFDVKRDPPKVSYNTAANSLSGMGELMRKIRRLGFCLIYDSPTTPEATESLLECIGPIRNTHYGGFYDFTSDLSSKDTAYTSLALDLHTDTTYFTDPVGLQLFHLLSHTDGMGGGSQLADGFAAAQHLREHDPAAFEALSKVRIFSHASGNDGVSIQPADSNPVFSHHRRTGSLHQIRWNNSDRASFDLDACAEAKSVEHWYAAARKWSELLKDEKASWRYDCQLSPGTMLVFDNWRVLHGRSSFTGKRRMAGGYISRDDFVSRYKMTNCRREDLLECETY